MLRFFVDPVLRGPTIGCMLMALSASVVGVLAFLKKRSLIGEALSHATYPGVVGAVLIGALTSFGDEGGTPILVLVGAFISAMVGLLLIDWLEKKLKVAADAALCLILSVFFGVGLTIASHIQFAHTAEYKQSLIYLYGQAATMTDLHILVYGLLAVAVCCIIWLFFKEIQSVHFDPKFSSTIGIKTAWIEALTFFLIVLAVVIGIRSVGVVLMSAMLIAPAVTARQMTHKLSRMLWIAGLVGLLSGFFGNVLSVVLSESVSVKGSGRPLSLPTGPMIVIVASLFSFLALLFAPERGWVVRLFRVMSFRHTCVCENVLKYFWRKQEGLTVHQLSQIHGISHLYLRFVIYRLISNGWSEKREGHFFLTTDGNERAQRIVRLHRLWEVYLVDYLGLGQERVHRNAEEMEHIITPELEEKLTKLLNDPKLDPHHQPIPPKEVL